MKKSIWLLIAASIMAACSPSEPHYVINGEISGADTVTFYLLKRGTGKTDTISTAVAKNGSFKMKGGQIEYPQLVQLVAGNSRNRAQFYLENTEIKVKGSLDSLFKAEVTGSKTQDEYTSLINQNKTFSDRYTVFFTQYQVASKAGDIAKSSDLQKQMEGIESEMMQLQKDFVRDNPASYVTPSLLSSLSYDMDPVEVEQAIAKLDTSLANHPQIVSLGERVKAMKVVAVGQKAPDFTMNDVNGNPVALSSKVGPKLLLVDFWAAWCGPCRQENPNVVKVFNEFNKKGFDVYGVSLDRTKEDWVKAIADDKLAWTHVSDLQYWNNSAAKLYAVSAIPANFLLDETGTIIARNLRGEALYNKVKEVLGAK